MKRSTARKPRGFSNSTSRPKKFTGRYWHYVFEQNGHAIGDFNMIDAASGLIIERDNGEGTADKACPAGQRGENCFPDLAKFKRVYKIELSDANVGKPVRKIAYIDLMKIKDPDKKARKPLNDGVLTFPFFTIENVDRVDDDAYHRRQRQQFAVLLEPRAQQGGRQRIRAAGSGRIFESEVRASHLRQSPGTVGAGARLRALIDSRIR